MSPIDIVTKEKHVGRIQIMLTVYCLLEHMDHIVVLSMDITDYKDRLVKVSYIWLLLHVLGESVQ